jgi:hypothetical protein
MLNSDSGFVEVRLLYTGSKVLQKFQLHYGLSDIHYKDAFALNE